MFEKIIRFIKLKILHLNDSPYSIALGIAIGLFVGWMPALGFQTAIAVFFAFVFKANKFLAAAMVWVSNPFTIIPVYYPSYLVGKSVVGVFTNTPKLSPEQVMDLFRESLSFTNLIVNIHETEFWRQLFSFLLNLGLELFIGGVIIGGSVAVIFYFVTYHFVSWYRAKHPRKRFEKFAQ